MMKQVFILALSSLLSVACSQSEPLRQFDNIRVSDPRVVEGQLMVDIVNDTGHDLCYFEDGLSYGPKSTEGSSGKTEILRPAIGNASLKELKLSNTNRPGFKLVRLPRGDGQISIRISGQHPLAVGDDLTFSIIYCDPESDGLHRSLVYSSRFK